MKEAPESEPEMPEEGDDDSDSEGDDYSDAGATIRQALDEKDDAALAEAICHLIDIHTGKDEGSDEEPPGPGKKPNIALILASKARK